MGNADTLQLLIAGGPGAPGADALVRRATDAVAAGARARILLTGAGLHWMEEASLAALAAGEGVDVALCSRSAREQGYAPERIPGWVRWSSMVRWLLDRPDGAPLWTLLP